MLQYSRWTTARHVWLALLLLLARAGLQAQEPGSRREAVEIQRGHLQNLQTTSFRMPGLMAGDRLEVRLSGTSGNLDPVFAILQFSDDLRSSVEELRGKLRSAAEEGRNSYAAFQELAGQYVVAYDDDSGSGYDAWRTVMIPADGDYRIYISGGTDILSGGGFAPAVSRVGRRISQGDYQLMVGLNTRLTSSSQPSGEPVLQREEAERPISIHRIQGEVSAERPYITYQLKDFLWGETVRIHISATTEEGLAPRVRLLDFGGKELAHANLMGNQHDAEFYHSFASRAANHRLIVEATDDGERKFVMLVGRGTRQRLGETTEEQGEQLVDEPLKVRVALALEQITGVNQKAENFGAVATVILEWEDPRLAFSAASCDCERRVFDLADFEAFVTRRNATWPQFILKNQQGNRWVQERLVQVETSGFAQYLERFTTTFQAPEFDFRDFPLDEQDFFVHIKCLRPMEEFVLLPDSRRSALGEKLGEEEWVMRDFGVEEENEGRYSGIAFRFVADRQLVYYLLRVLIPITLIILIGWMSFLIKDYSKRLDISCGNLLAFIAFNFTISSDLPRLGYVTFIDMLMIVTFIICALLIGLNVHFRRQEALGNTERIERIDRWVVWLYPFAFIIPPLTVYLMAL